MKMKNVFKSLLAVLTILFSVFCFTRTAKAANSNLTAGREISIANLSGNLNNINIKIEFTTSVNLDGTNNALLIGLVSSDGTILTDARFVASSTNQGVYDENGVSIVFGNPPSTIGNKTYINSNYTYTIETRDFTIVNGNKNISKLVIVGQKGTEISTEVTFSEVKYSVKFGNNSANLYSYNSLINAPEVPYTYDINGHYETCWQANDSSMFVSGTTRATKDITYNAVLGALEVHNWNNVEEVKGTRNVDGVKAHQECSVCGAKRLNNESVSLANDEDLRLVHICEYEISYNWNNAPNPGDKPVITYTCNDQLCGYSHTMNSSDITITEKLNSRVNATCTETGSVTYVASCTYEGQNASSEKTYILPVIAHSLSFHQAVSPTCTEAGTNEYYSCSVCGKKFTDSNGSNKINNFEEYLPVQSLGHSFSSLIAQVDPTCTEAGTLEHKHCSRCGKDFDKNGVELNSLTINALGHDLIEDAAVAPTCTTPGREIGHHCSRCDYTDGGETIPSLGHNLIEDAAIAPTCTETGKTLGHHCTRCEYTDGGDVIPANGHTFGELQAQVDPTCIESGTLEHKHCSVCSKDFDKNGVEINDLTIPSLGHNLIEDAAIAPTCTETGKTLGHHCTRCEYTDGGDVIPANGHTFGELQAQVDPTCTEDGTKAHKDCSVCHKHFDNEGTEILDLAIPSLGHDLIEDATITPTCTENGREAGHHCSRCDYIDGRETIKALGHNYEWVVDKAATYTETGLKHEECTRCPIKRSENTIIDKIDHNHVLLMTEGTDATCTETGLKTYYTCSICSKHFSDDEGQLEIEDLETYLLIPALGHTYTALISKFDSTCIEVGTKEHKDCTVCGKHFDKDGVEINDLTIPSLGHDLIEDAAIAPTCTESGREAGHHCTRCDYTDGGLIIPALGHDLIEDPFIAPTCIKNGRELGLHCSRCDYSVGGETINALGHDLKEDPAISPTCTETGKEAGHHCSRCDYTDGGVIIPALGHNLITDQAVPATCTETGKEIGHHCTRCDYTDGGVIIPALGHDLIEDPAIAPTCTETGKEAGHHCSRCEYTDGGEIIDALGHEYAWVIDKAATIYETGQKHEECSRCHDKRNENTIIEKLDHNHELLLTDAVAPTCTETGTKAYYTCSICNKHYSDSLGQNEIEDLESYLISPALGHKLEKAEVKAPTCTMDGNIEYYECGVCHKKFSDSEGLNEITDVVVYAHHNLVMVSAIEGADCQTKGTIEYYECSVCHKKFNDANATSEISSIEGELGNHKLSKVEGVSPTCTEDGTIEYYECSVCHKKFSDFDGTTEITNIIDPARHKLTKVDAVAPTCTSMGNIEYYHCSRCDKDFDVDGNEIDNPFLPFKHSLIKYNEKAATCERDGNIEYYECKDCHKRFSDVECTDEIVGDVVIHSIGHQFGGDGRCTICGKMNPEYKRGCKSSISTGAIFSLIGLTAIIIKKKKKFQE